MSRSILAWVLGTSVFVLTTADIGLAQEAKAVVGIVTGTVTDAVSGEPVADVEVRMVTRPEKGFRFPLQPTRVRSDSTGRYRFENVTPGEHGVYAFHGSKASRTEYMKFAQVTVAADGSSPPVDLKLTEGRSLKVRVLAAETGQPIRGALVQLIWTDLDDNAVTDQEGNVVISGLTSRDQHVEAKAPGYQLMAVQQALKDNVTEVQFKLPSGGAIHGSIVDDKGKPIEGAAISASPERGTDRFDYVKSDAQGKFVLNYVPNSQSIRVHAFLKDYQNELVSFSLNGEPYRPLEITLKPRSSGGEAEVTVVDQQGQPIAGAQILNQGSSSVDQQWLTTDSAGRCLIERMYLRFQRTDAEVSVRAEGFAPKLVTVTPSKTGPVKTTVALDKGRRFRGRIVNQAGEPVVPGLAYITDSNYGGGLATFKLPVSPDGRISSNSLGPDARLTIDTPSYTPKERIEIPLDQDEEYVITLEPRGRLRGIVTNTATNEPIRKFTLKMAFARTVPTGAVRSTGMPSDWGSKGRTFNDQAGKFTWDGLPNNTAYDLIVEAEGFEATRLKSVVSSREETDLSCKLEPVDVSALVEVAGVVLDQKGDPLEGINVHLIAIDPAVAADDARGTKVTMYLIRIHQAKNIPSCKVDHETVTAADGRFRFPKVSGKLKLQLAYWGDDTPSTRIQDVETRPTEKLRNIEILAQPGVTITGRINSKSYPNAGRVRVSESREDFDNREANLQTAKDRTKFTIRACPQGEMQVTLMSEGTPYRENGTTFYRSEALATRTVTAKAGETIEVNFD